VLLDDQMLASEFATDYGALYVFCKYCS